MPMPVIERFLARLGYVKANRVSEVLVPSWHSQYGAQIPTGISDYLNTYGASSWVYACASLIAATAAQASFLLYKAVKRDGKVNYDQIIDHPVLDLLNRPNPFMSGFELRELTHLNLELAGNHYWVLLRDGLNIIREIWPVSPALMKVVPDPQNYIRGYLMEVAGERAAFEPDEVIHFKYPNPTNPEDSTSQFYGIGTVQAARLAITGDLYSSRWNVKFFANSARPDGVLETDQKLEEPTAKRLLAWWENAHKSTDKAHKTGMLTHGLKYKQVTVNPKDMDFLKQRQFGMNEILAIFGVPASKLGIMEDANRANAEAGDYTFGKDVIMPKLVRKQERMNVFLLPKFDEKLWGEFENIVPENQEQIRKDRETGWNKWLTINEIREEDGKPPVEGGDVLYIPLSLYPLDEAQSVGDGKAAFKAEAAKGCRTLRVLAPEEQGERRKRQALRERLAKISDEDRWDLFVKRISPQEKRFQRILKRLFQGQENEVRERVRAGETDVDKIIYDREAWQEKFRAAGYPLILEAVRAAGEEAMQEVRMAEGETKTKGLFDVTNPLVVQYITDKLFKFARQVDVTTASQLRIELVEAVELGESVTQIEDRVAGVFRIAKTIRTETIARTEIVGASNQGALLGYKQSGVVPKKRWVVALDERTREWHAAMVTADPVPIDEPFIVGGEEMNAPGDTNASARNVVNCRCTVAPVVES